MAALTANEQKLVFEIRRVLPEMFGLAANDDRILAYANLVISDFAMWPPQTFDTVDTVVHNPQVLSIIIFGSCVFAELFMQMNATLQDFTFSDQGFSVQVDQVTKIQQSLTNMMEVYKKMIKAYKVNLILNQGPVGIGTPRYQSQLGQFLKIALGSAFTWNSN